MTASDTPYAVQLADYRAAVLADLRRAGLAASEAIRLMRRESDTVEAGLDAGVDVQSICGALLVFWQDMTEDYS